MREQSDYSKLWASLRLFQDTNGLSWLKGRFANSSPECDEQHPIILRIQESSYFTKLIILDAKKLKEV